MPSNDVAAGGRAFVRQAECYPRWHRQIDFELSDRGRVGPDWDHEPDDDLAKPVVILRQCSQYVQELEFADEQPRLDIAAVGGVRRPGDGIQPFIVLELAHEPAP